MSSDLLKEAIADAKAVRETALENAKMALEEAFTPQLKSMLSAKLKEEDLEEDEFYEGEHEDEDEAEEGMHDDDEAEEGRMTAGMHDDEAEEGRHEEDEDDDEVDESNIIEIDGVKYAPIVAEEDDEDDEEAEEGMHEEDNLDLEAVIKELESELSEGEDDDEDDKEEGRGMKEEEEIEEEYEIDEAALTEKEDDDDDDKDEVDEQSTSSGIGKGTGVKVATASDEEDPQGAKIVKAKMESVQAELGEYKEAVEYLKNKLHEVNLLNAKLLFTNKLFKEFTLDNSQKLKVVETFDRTQSTREIKLVYSTLAEQFSDNGSIKRKSIKESASSAVGSTKPSKESSKVITEEEAVANRFQKLAGLING